MTPSLWLCAQIFGWIFAGLLVAYLVTRCVRPSQKMQTATPIAGKMRYAYPRRAGVIEYLVLQAVGLFAALLIVAYVATHRSSNSKGVAVAAAVGAKLVQNAEDHHQQRIAGQQRTWRDTAETWGLGRMARYLGGAAQPAPITPAQIAPAMIQAELNNALLAQAREATDGTADEAQRLIGLGADINAMDDEDHRAIYLAAWHGNWPVFNLLQGQTNIEMPLEDNDQTLLNQAILGGNLDIVNAVLAMNEVYLATADKDGYTAVHAAAEQAIPATIMERLIEFNRDQVLACLPIQNEAEQTPLQIAEDADTGNAEVAQVLRELEQHHASDDQGPIVPPLTLPVTNQPAPLRFGEMTERLANQTPDEELRALLNQPPDRVHRNTVLLFLRQHPKYEWNPLLLGLAIRSGDLAIFRALRTAIRKAGVQIPADINFINQAIWTLNEAMVEAVLEMPETNLATTDLEGNNAIHATLLLTQSNPGHGHQKRHALFAKTTLEKLLAHNHQQALEALQAPANEAGQTWQQLAPEGSKRRAVIDAFLQANDLSYASSAAVPALSLQTQATNDETGTPQEIKTPKGHTEDDAGQPEPNHPASAPDQPAGTGSEPSENALFTLNQEKLLKDAINAGDLSAVQANLAAVTTKSQKDFIKQAQKAKKSANSAAIVQLLQSYKPAAAQLQQSAVDHKKHGGFHLPFGHHSTTVSASAPAQAKEEGTNKSKKITQQTASNAATVAPTASHPAPATDSKKPKDSKKPVKQSKSANSATNTAGGAQTAPVADPAPAPQTNQPTPAAAPVVPSAPAPDPSASSAAAANDANPAPTAPTIAVTAPEGTNPAAASTVDAAPVDQPEADNDGQTALEASMYDRLVAAIESGNAPDAQVDSVMAAVNANIDAVTEGNAAALITMAMEIQKSTIQDPIVKAIHIHVAQTLGLQIQLQRANLKKVNSQKTNEVAPDSTGTPTDQNL